MKEIHVRRHAEKNADGTLTDNGVRAALELSQTIPPFARVIASDSNRAQLTANLLTGVEVVTDIRAGLCVISLEKVDVINRISSEQGLTFLEAVDLYQDAEILSSIDDKASALNQLIDELFEVLGEDEKVLIVSHDLTIGPAMAKRGIQLEPIDPLEGYVLKSDGSITATTLVRS